MLHIYRIALLLCRDCQQLIRQIQKHDPNLADQLRRAVTSIALNIAEGDGQTGGNRRQRRLTALGSAREVNACLEIATELEYIQRPSSEIRNRINQVTGTLVNLLKS
jgi:four helix bundle protein